MNVNMGKLWEMMRDREASAQDQAPAPKPDPKPAKTETPDVIPFGHARDYGRPTEVIEWGSNGKYAVAAPLSREREAAQGVAEAPDVPETDA